MSRIRIIAIASLSIAVIVAVVVSISFRQHRKNESKIENTATNTVPLLVIH